jgi:rsbT antagonist protein RsbS
MSVPVMQRGNLLIAALDPEVGDDELLTLHGRLSETVGRLRARGVIVDVTELDVLDSFGTRALQSIAKTLELRGAVTVIVGIQPDVAFAMIQLGLRLDGVTTALDLDAGLAVAREQIALRSAV